jgi:hypothetical protein
VTLNNTTSNNSAFPIFISYVNDVDIEGQ